MLEAAAHGLVAAIVASLLTLVVGKLPIGHRPTLTDTARIALIVFCVAAGHTAGIAAGRAAAGIMFGALAGLVLAAVVPRVWARRRA